jgi:hypothetical protein
LPDGFVVGTLATIVAAPIACFYALTRTETKLAHEVVGGGVALAETLGATLREGLVACGVGDAPGLPLSLPDGDGDVVAPPHAARNAATPPNAAARRTSRRVSWVIGSRLPASPGTRRCAPERTPPRPRHRHRPPRPAHIPARGPGYDVGTQTRNALAPAPDKMRGGSRRSRLTAVPVKVRRTGRPPRAKGIYHVGCTDYPDPTYP